MPLTIKQKNAAIYHLQQREEEKLKRDEIDEEIERITKQYDPDEDWLDELKLRRKELYQIFVNRTEFIEDLQDIIIKDKFEKDLVKEKEAREAPLREERLRK